MSKKSKIPIPIQLLMTIPVFAFGYWTCDEAVMQKDKTPLKRACSLIQKHTTEAQLRPLFVDIYAREYGIPLKTARRKFGRHIHFKITRSVVYDKKVMKLNVYNRSNRLRSQYCKITWEDGKIVSRKSK